MRRGILVPFDGSDNAVAALQTAITLAKALAENIILLNVQPSFQTLHTKMFFNRQVIRGYQEQLFAEAVAGGKRLLDEAGVRYMVKMRVGDEQEQICLEAADADQDEQVCAGCGVRWIVMGARGLRTAGKALGRVSYGVVKAAPCPVMIVPCKDMAPGAET
ncbi:MAG: universal stress protein, partial [Bacillota bacterium]